MRWIDFSRAVNFLFFLTLVAMVVDATVELLAVVVVVGEDIVVTEKQNNKELNNKNKGYRYTSIYLHNRISI